MNYFLNPHIVSSGLSSGFTLTQCAKCGVHTGARILKAPKISREEELFEKVLLFIKLTVLIFSVLYPNFTIAVRILLSLPVCVGCMEQ